jgi:hypothetical protein
MQAGALITDRSGANGHVACVGPRLNPPEVPTRMNVCAPMAANSSTAMAVEGQPIPVEVTDTFSPSNVPV